MQQSTNFLKNLPVGNLLGLEATEWMEMALLGMMVHNGCTLVGGKENQTTRMKNTSIYGVMACGMT